VGKFMSNFKFVETKLKGLYIVESKIYGDNRGYFMESYKYKDFSCEGLGMEFIQDNESVSTKGVLRGLHYQEKHPQGKLVRVFAGEVYDVAVDIRKQSKTYGQWVGVVLSGENKKQLYIPEGFAHGFLVLSEKATFIYKCTDYYYPENEKGIIYNCKDLNIDWNRFGISEYIISDKDRKLADRL
jgi:dTDP-4-dehydrorhamnose 3,5-epimerase